MGLRVFRAKGVGNQLTASRCFVLEGFRTESSMLSSSWWHSFVGSILVLLYSKSLFRWQSQQYRAKELRLSRT